MTKDGVSRFERRQFDAALIERALVDSEFRERLVSDPKSVYEESLGRKIPNEVQIHVVEETGNILYIAIPHAPSSISSEDAMMIASGQRTHREPCWGLGDGID